MYCALCVRRQLEVNIDPIAAEYVNAAITVYNGMALCVVHLLEVSQTYDPVPGDMPKGGMNS